MQEHPMILLETRK